MEEDGKWKAGFCSCCELFPLCLVSLICPCITQGISAWEISQQGGCGECLAGCYCCCIGMALNSGKIRSNYRIKGNCIGDCCLFCYCCYSCMVTREYLHIVKESKDKKNNLV